MYSKSRTLFVNMYKYMYTIYSSFSEWHCVSLCKWVDEALPMDPEGYN